MLRVAAAVALSSAPVARAWDNSCLEWKDDLNPPTKDAPTTFLSECAKWVIDSTDAVWRPDATPEEVNRSLEEYFYVDWLSVGPPRAKGMPKLKELVWKVKKAYPDYKVHVADVFCAGNDIDGYKTAMPDILTGTNTATGRKVSFNGIAVCYIQKVNGKWQYIAEWVLHNSASMLASLGDDNVLDAPDEATTAPHDCRLNLPGWGWQPPKTLPKPVPEVTVPAVGFQSSPGNSFDAIESGYLYTVPHAKRIIQSMDYIISNHISVYDWVAWRETMLPWWTEDFVYDSVLGIGNSTGLYDWFKGEHIEVNDAFKAVKFNQMIFVGEEATGSTTTYGKAFWRNDFAYGKMKATHKPVMFRICDFYRFRGDKISYNWMMIDMVGLAHQSGEAEGKRVLPAAPVLRDDGYFRPPDALDGAPAPQSELTPPEMREDSRKVANALLEREWFSLSKSLSSDDLWHADTMNYYGPVGVGHAQGYKAYKQHVLGVLRNGFSDTSYTLDVLSCEGAYCAAHGYVHGTHTGCFLGEQPTGKRVSLRMGMHWRIVDGKAAEGWAMWDVPALFKQLGVELFDRLKPSGPKVPSACSPEEGNLILFS
eukprot:TRINITY_DN282_c0_g2_i1.p1 TRINITY_DN282_c0_g2~~TRINITY_DN282_c0_g2_i1.p1  ORF type:complete len:593 (+),score=124.87 TRINITY_DN282_c0_g2_i1:72-1850(+)